MSREPLLLYTAHSAPMQMAFYDSDHFPAEYRNSTFVAMHGSGIEGRPADMKWSNWSFVMENPLSSNRS